MLGGFPGSVIVITSQMVDGTASKLRSQVERVLILLLVWLILRREVICVIDWKGVSIPVTSQRLR